MGHPPTLPNGHAPLTEGWVDEGEAQGAQLPKKPRRREEGSEAQWEGSVVKKRFPLRPRPILTHVTRHIRRT